MKHIIVYYDISPALQKQLWSEDMPHSRTQTAIVQQDHPLFASFLDIGTIRSDGTVVCELYDWMYYFSYAYAKRYPVWDYVPTIEQLWLSYVQLHEIAEHEKREFEQREHLEESTWWQRLLNWLSS